MDKEKVCAIIPAFNEAERIGEILEKLSKSKLIDEIIVSDDGSTDNLKDVVSKYDVKYVCSEYNLGKGHAMDLGVQNTDATVLFFCDADLTNFNYADEIIQPVLDGLEMFIGLRFNLYSNKLILWSGQRALKRSLWSKIPKFYKKGFRIEIGLNLFCKEYKLGKFEYGQVLKEMKHGWFNGLYRRIFMYWHIVSAIVAFPFHQKGRKDNY